MLWPNGTFAPGVVGVVDGVVVSVESWDVGAVPGADDSTENVLVPAFVDLQVNGIDDVDVWAVATSADEVAWHRLEESLIDRGVGAWCPTLVTAPLERYGSAVEFLANRPSRDGRPLVVGVHLEGPFLGSATGAHRAELVREPGLSFFDGLSQRPLIVTMGAEHPRAESTIRELSRRGVTVSLGHTRPDRSGYESAVNAGVRMVTHVHNAMSGMGHRDPGLATWVLNDERVVAGLIADGVHVHPDVVRLTFRCKPDAVALVTDSVAWRAGRAGPVRLTVRDGAPRLEDGTLAGASAGITDALRTCRRAGVPLVEALRAATATPARVIGRDDLGEIRAGTRANLVELDANLDVVGVWLDGVRRR